MKSTPLKNTLLCKMIALLLALVLMLPLFYFRSHAAEGDGEPEILYEDVRKRSTTEKHFVCSDGSMIAVTYAQEVHQPDGKGGFEDLDNRLALNSATGRYENTGNRRFSVSLATTDTGSPVTVQGKDAPALSMVTRVIQNGRILSPELLPLNLKAEVGSANTIIGQKVSDAAFELNSFVSSLTSSAAYGNSSGISSKYTLVGNGLKEDIILERNTGVVGFKTEYTVSGLTAAADKDGSLCFTDQTGKSVYSVSSPYVFDAAGSVCPAVSVTLRQTLSGYAVTYTPDSAWLSSDERVYPITFDPLVSDSSLNKSRLTATAYTDNGTTVTKANNSISVGFDKSVTPNKRTYTGLYISPLAYPQVDTDHYEVKNMTLTLTVKERTGTVMLRSCLLKPGENPSSAGFTPSGTMSSVYTVFSSTTATEISLPLDYYKNQNQSTPTYLLMPYINTSGNGARNVTYYGPAETNALKHPVLKVSYSLRESFDEKVGFISRTDGGITRYLSVDENNNLTASITPYRWIFEEYLTGYGEYVIRSYENSGICLKTGTNGTVSAVSYPVLPEEPSTSYFWAPILYDNALGSYLFYSNTGGGFLHLNTTDYSLTLSSTSGIDEHAWVVQAFSLDGSTDEEISLGVFTFQNGEYTSQYMAISGSYNYNMDNNSRANVVLSTETQNYDNGAFRLRYVPTEHAYRIAPICSGNGYYRVVSRATGSVDIGINQIRTSNSNYQLFDILRFSNGFIGFQMKGTAKALSVENKEVVLRDYTEGNLKQRWLPSVYTYKDSGMTYVSVDEYYHSLNFGSPFGANGRSLIMTSGYGPRKTDNGSRVHAGLDLRTRMDDDYEDNKRDLYSPLSGTVVAINTSLGSSMGRYVILRVNCDSLEEDQSIYVIYMHLSSVNKKSTSNPEGIYKGMAIDTTILIGKSGSSGETETEYDAHLHIGVFFAPENQSTFSSAQWRDNSLNPLLFYTPDGYDVGS